MRISDLKEAAADPLPSKFWLVFDIPVGIYGNSDLKQQRLADIARGELTGVRGISESRQIMTGWFMIGRNACLLMDPHEVATLNDIEKVHYDDPDWLCANNFAALYRIWDKEGSFQWRHEGMMMNLAQYVVGAMKDVDYNTARMMEYSGFATKFGYQWQEHHESEKVTNSQDAAAFFAKYFPVLLDKYGQSWTKPNDDEVRGIRWHDAVRAALRKVGEVYSDEAEWLVMNPSFKIPKGSTLLVGINPEVAKLHAEWTKTKGEFRWEGARYSLEAHDELMQALKSSHLSDHYNMKLVDGRRFDQLRPKVMDRRKAK